ncbi:MAG: type VI secretion system baseplate subunit TssF [Candidatus Latescibacteria bacterium]|nr:type VI secretion system baseplate subunit TssF [Candidatus Latescibacterota bacterium]
MFNIYYQQELQNLRDLAREFSKVHPSIAPLLSGTSSDPDVERLLEGVAFLTGLLHRKLDDEFPEIIHGLMDIIFPHFLRPIPSTSIVVFSPKPSMQETIKVTAGTSLASIPVEGTSCFFRTCFDTEVHPLRLKSAELTQKSGQNDLIRLVFELSGQNLSQWQPKCLSFFLGSSYTQASNLYMLLTKYVKNIILKSVKSENKCYLPPSSLIPSGLLPENSLLPFPTHSFRGYRFLQEYFILPQKFLFLELQDFEKWTDRGNGSTFEIIFEMGQSPLPVPKIGIDNFILFATPVINLFHDDNDQFTLDHRLEKIRVRPSTKSKDHYQVFSVDKVVGFKQGSVAQKEYTPLELFSHQKNDSSVYQVIHARSPIDNSPELYLSFTYPPEGPAPEPETLTMSLTYTNGTLPERLQLGDICEQTSNSPGLLDFKNILPPTAPVEPLLGKNTLWRLLSHLSLNLLKISNTDSIKNLLRLYTSPEGKDRTKISANMKRIDGIEKFIVTPVDRLDGGQVIRGQKIDITARVDHFACLGDLYIFISVLDLFLGMYSSMNSFMQLTLKDSITGEAFTWPARLGDRPLI